MERFQDVLHNAECSKDSVKFSFKKEAEFDQIKKAWEWVNSADKKYIVLVTENARCNTADGDPTARQPWHITKAVFDDPKNTVTLSAEPKTWEDAFSHWRLRVSSKGIWPHNPHYKHGLVKRIGYNDTASLPLGASFSTGGISLTGEDDSTQVSIACNPCYTTGSLDFDIDVDWELFEGLSGTITMTPNDVGAYIMAQVSVEERLTHTVSTGLNLLTIAPDAIYIPGIIDIGPGFKVDLVAGIEAATAEIDIASGVAMTIPPDAIAVLDFDDSSRNQFYDWTPQFTPIMPDNFFSQEISVEAYIGAQLRVEFDIQIVGQGFSAGLALNAPTLDLTLSEMAQDGNVCDVPGADFGVSFDIALGAEVDGFAGFGAATDLPNKMALASTSFDIYSTCLVVASGPPPSASAAPSQSYSTVEYSSPSAYSRVDSSAYSYLSSEASSRATSSAYTLESSSYIASAASAAEIPCNESLEATYRPSSALVLSDSYAAPVVSSSAPVYGGSDVVYLTSSVVVYYTTVITEYVGSSAVP